MADASRIQVSRFCQTDARRVHRSDSSPWYIPIKDEYPNGGYEVSVAFCEPEIDDVLTDGMKRILPGRNTATLAFVLELAVGLRHFGEKFEARSN